MRIRRRKFLRNFYLPPAKILIVCRLSRKADAVVEPAVPTPGKLLLPHCVHFRRERRSFWFSAPAAMHKEKQVPPWRFWLSG